MPRPPDHLSPRVREIVTVARQLLDEEGPDGLSMRRIAAELGIRAPSLYKHVADKRALENAIISDGLVEQGDRAAAAVARARAAGEDPLLAIAMDFRDFAVGSPHLYGLMTGRPLNHAELAPGAEEYAGEALRAVLDGNRQLGLTLWAFSHGMVTLEIAGRFPAYGDADAVWRAGLASIRLGVAG